MRSALAAIMLPSVLILFLAHSAHAQSPDQVPLANRGQVVVTGQDLEAKLGDMDEASRLVALQKSDRLGLLLDSTLLALQMADEARALGLDQDPLVRRQMELAAYEVLSNHLVRHKLAQESTEERQRGLEQYAREQFIANRDSFNVPTVVKVRHLLIGNDEEQGLSADKRALAESLLERARNGEDFEQLVMAHSDDRSKQFNAGIIEVTRSADMYESFKSAAMALTPSIPLSGLVQTPYGMHIIQYVDRTEGVERSFDEVKATLMDNLSRRYDERRKQLLLSRLRSDQPDHDEQAISAYVDSLQQRLEQINANTGAQ